MREKSNDFNSFVLGLIVGGILGTLYAPQKGEETRKVLKKLIEEWSEKGADLSDEVKEVFEEWKEKAEPIVEEIEEKITPVAQKIKERTIEQITPIIEEVKEKAEPIAEKIEAVPQDSTESEIVQKAPPPPPVPQPYQEFRPIEPRRPKYFRGV